MVPSGEGPSRGSEGWSRFPLALGVVYISGLSLAPLGRIPSPLMARRAPSSKKQGRGDVGTVCFIAATGNAQL